MNFVLRTCALFMLFCIFTEAKDVNVDQVTYAYYEISGSNAGELRLALNKYGPFDDSGTRHDARTMWHVSWSFPADTANHDLSDYSKSKVTVMIIIILPRLNAEVKLDEATRRKWDSYIVKLKEHEELHAKFARDCRSEIEVALRKNKKEDGNDIARQILDKYKKLEIDMDKKTNHGIKDGAKFP